MIRKIFGSFAFLGLAFLLFQCGASSSKGLTINGTVDGSGNLKVYFDKFGMNNKNSILASQDISSNGQFTMQFEEPMEAGIYRLRIGSQRAYVFLNGDEKKLEVSGNLPDLSSGNYSIEGSPATTQYNEVFSNYIGKKYNAEDLKSAIQELDNPLAALLLAQQAFRNDFNYLDTYKDIETRLASNMPESEYVAGMKSFVGQLEAMKMQAAAQGRIKVGEEAPDIKLPNPDGKEMALSELRGKVVLLDFWASWCGPCRRENPNVVRVYEKYNNDGFEVFSVSLDRQNGKQRWIDAIAKDGLKWPYHVSDLQYWNSAPAKMYNVSGIPRTFLIDKEGRIAAINPRGPKLEPAVKQLLSQT